MPERPLPLRRTSRAEPRDVVELRLVKSTQPELAEAVDLQIALLDLQRRVQSRIPLPWFEVDPAWLGRQQKEGLPLLQFDEIPIDWTELRLMFRQAADILLRFHEIEPGAHRGLQAIARTANALEPLVARWYSEGGVPSRAARRQSNGAPAPWTDGTEPGARAAPVDADVLNQVLALAMRPFLERCAESIQQRTDLTQWAASYCPVCAGEVEFAVITPGAERLLICSRCTARWRFDAVACPFCGNADRSRITSFASRDKRYRLYGCDACLRYLKAFDGRNAGRPLMLAVDTIATLPLDAAAQKKGYRG